MIAVLVKSLYTRLKITKLPLATRSWQFDGVRVWLVSKYWVLFLRCLVSRKSKLTVAQIALRAQFARLIAMQLLLLVLATAAAYFLSGRALAASVYCGAVAFALPAALCGWYLMRDCTTAAMQSLLRFYALELIKLVASVALLWWAVRSVNTNMLPTLAAYFLMMCTVCFAPCAIRGSVSSAATAAVLSPTQEQS